MASSASTPLTSQAIKNATLENRLGFVRKVYGILSVQLAVTAGIAWPIVEGGAPFIREYPWLMPLSICLLVTTMCVLCCCRESLRRFPTNYMVLALVTVAVSLSVGLTAATYTIKSVGVAALITSLIFVAMTIYAWTTTSDFTGMGPYLFGAMMCIFMFGFAISIFSWFGFEMKLAQMMYSAICVLLFTFYIVYDTQLIMGEFGGHKVSFGLDDYAFAALNLYLDIMNLFVHLLALLGKRR
eukprot:TRINITY_DN4065_c0_g3_i1.p1 TRINITY_DN4065_c0_g3~~TRINITY_DN4065_c0_g3_i1.p1  ORF type:complete len:241 (-),score=30.74 TRINITY_DN4065_c0_g3_i1:50-772(-)